MAETPMTEEDAEAFRGLVYGIARGIWRWLNTQLRRRYAYDDLFRIGWEQSGPQHPLHWCGIKRLYPIYTISMSTQAA